jgi:Stabilization of polarity axis
LVNGLLTQKRIIFLGHGMPSGDVAEAVLAACALASGGLLRGFTRHAFPYTDLTKIDDLLNVPGFIAGVTNPTFELHPEWWDILCDLPSGRVKISSKIEPAMPTDGLQNYQQQNPAYAALAGGLSGQSLDLTGDAAFMADILRSIAARHGERVIRAKWRDWVLKFTRIAAQFEESVYGVSALYIGSEDQSLRLPGASGHGYVWPDDAARHRELAGNITRIEGWRNTRSYYSFVQVREVLAGRGCSDSDPRISHNYIPCARSRVLTWLTCMINCAFRNYPLRKVGTYTLRCQSTYIPTMRFVFSSA